MTYAGVHTTSIYDSEIREIAHDLGYYIINQSYWYSDTDYTEETAIECYKAKHHIEIREGL